MKFLTKWFTLLCLCAFFTLTFLGPSIAADLSTELIELKTRQGVTQKFVLIRPENPVAAVVMLAGNNGYIKLSSFLGSTSIGSIKKDFLVRNRKALAENNLMIAVMDAPSDKQTKGKSIFGGLNTFTAQNELFRMSDEHAQDISSVVSYLKRMENMPVWLVGSSMGTISAANAAIRIKTGIDGLVLTSSKTRSDKNWGAIYKSHPNVIIDMDLDKIIVPTMIIHHRMDRCGSSAPGEVPKIKEGLVNASKAELRYFSGGKDPGGKDGCIPNGFHSFHGIDDEVIGAISNYVISNSK